MADAQITGAQIDGAQIPHAQLDAQFSIKSVLTDLVANGQPGTAITLPTL